VKAQTKTDKFTMEIMKGRDDKRPLVSVLIEHYVQCVCLVIVLIKFHRVFVESAYSIEYLPLSYDVYVECINDQTVARYLFMGCFLS